MGQARADDPLEERFIELESRYMHVSDLVDKLNAALVEQRGEIDALKAQVRRLREQADVGDELDATDRPPPHYGEGGSLYSSLPRSADGPEGPGTHG